jgi:Holliday junction resolvase-like predicted endonuclease
MLQKLPLDFSAFRALREENYLYVDKTEYAHRMITGGRYFFLARPRRFGKSLLISTLKEILEGNKELFEGLWIAKSDYQWKPHGVIALNISRLGIKNETTLKHGLVYELQEIATAYEIPAHIINYDEPELILSSLVKALHKRFGRVAILIDEYDSSIVHALTNPEHASTMRDEIRTFFAAIKGLDDFVNFTFITGVSSFIQSGLFSGINNVRIITLDERYTGACGYTDEEVDHYFTEYITAWAETEGSSFEETRTKIKEWYNGYHFGEKSASVYNPYSLMHALEAQKFKHYWFVSGLPTFLADFLKKEYRTFDSERLTIDSNTLQGSFDINAMPLKALMFQAGYLTIASYDKERQVYTLGYPNKEVRTSFQEQLLQAFAQLDSVAAKELPQALWIVFNSGNVEDIVDTIRQLFAHVPYQLHMKEEKYYHSLLQMALSIVGIKAQSEYSTSDGRIDLVLELPKLIYIIEVKFGDKAKEALAQIEQKKYYERFLHQAKKIILLGLAFKREPKKFDVDYAMKELSPSITEK